MRILYYATGTGAGPMVKALALKEDLLRTAPQHRLGVAIGTDYKHLVPQEDILRGHYYKFTEPNDQKKLEFLREAVREFKPDYILSCYQLWQVQQVHLETKIPIGLLWRKHMNFVKFMYLIDPALWDRVFGLEPGAVDEFQGLFKPEQLMEVGPIFSVWPDQVLSKEEARRRLLATWDIFDHGLPLLVAAHNGVSGVEVNSVLQNAMKINDRKYHKIVLSQNRYGNARMLPENLALFMRGIDHLVGAGGHQMFWDWQKYKRPEATETLGAARRIFDPQGWRILLDNKSILKYNRSISAGVEIFNSIIDRYA